MPISDTQTIQKYYAALANRDSQYVGIFFAAVKTTGIFCIATCRARKPKPENVLFYNSAKEALLAGFRPCKICKPTEQHESPPKDILEVLQLLHSKPSEKISDWQLKQKGYSPERIRRWFQQHYQMTFQGYQRMLRINAGYQLLKTGHKVTDSAFTSGYESLSGFGYSFKQLLGVSPEKSGQKTILHITRFTTPLGPMFACASEKGLCLLEFTDRRMLETELKDLCNRLDAVIFKGSNPHLTQTEKEIGEYFSGQRKNFSITLHTPGTAFQQKVWSALEEVPFGKTATYGKQAQKIGNPKAVRAIASANGYNRISIVIPCHRIIGSNGELCGYGGGLPRKQWLLDFEKERVG